MYKIKHGIVFPVLILMALPCLAKDQVTDIEKVLSEGNYAHAIKLYCAVNEVRPTAESYNNLGVALEKNGQLEEAVSAYALAREFPTATSVMNRNWKRVKVREWLQLFSFYTTSILVGIALIVMLYLTSRLIRHMHNWFRYRKIRLLQMSYQVQCQNGDDQPDDKIYPDSKSILFNAQLVIPQNQSLTPIELDLVVYDPGGKPFAKFRKSIESSAESFQSLTFKMDDIGRMMKEPGHWRADLVLANTSRTCGHVNLQIITREALIADLEITDFCLAALKKEQVTMHSVIYSDMDSIIPYGNLRPKIYHPDKFTDMNVRYELCFENAQTVKSYTLPLNFTQGNMSLTEAVIPIAGDPVAERTGLWTFNVFIDDQKIAGMPFLLMSNAEIRKHFDVDSFDIVAESHNGSLGEIHRVAHLNTLRSLSPVITLSGNHPKPLPIPIEITTLVCIDDEPVAEIKKEVHLEGFSIQFQPGEFVLPPLVNGQESYRCSFMLYVADRCLTTNEVLVRNKPSPCTDVQGGFTNSFDDYELDYDGDAKRILSEAVIRR